MRVSILWVESSGAFVGSDGFIHAAGIVIGVAELVVNLFGIRSEFERVLVSTNGFTAFPLLHFAVTNLHPGISPLWIPICRRFKVPDGVVVVAQPKRIQAGSVGRFGDITQPFPG